MEKGRKKRENSAVLQRYSSETDTNSSNIEICDPTNHKWLAKDPSISEMPAKRSPFSTFLCRVGVTINYGVPCTKVTRAHVILCGGAENRERYGAAVLSRSPSSGDGPSLPQYRSRREARHNASLRRSQPN